MKRFVMLMLILCLCCPCAYGDQTKTDAFADHAFSVRKVVGGAVMISRRGQVLYQDTYGFADGYRKVPVTEDTCFRIASVTKCITAIGLMQLYEQGMFRLDDSADEYLPFPVRNPQYPDLPITIRQILTHTTGFVQLQTYRCNWEKISHSKFIENAKPGTKYNYSNMNGGLIGSLIEALSGQSLNTYMVQHVFTPLSVVAAYHPGLLPEGTPIASVMDKNGYSMLSANQPDSELTAYNDTCAPRENVEHSVGGLYISANGLLRIAEMLENHRELDGVRILQPETVDLMMDYQAFDGSSVTCDTPYGLSLKRVNDLPGGTWYGHQGMKNGLSSDMFFQENTGLCIAVIANGYAPQSIDGIAGIARIFMEKAEEIIQE